ncbi:COX15/CtaA family protein [Erythrobacteraceae bacterium E2-1 Yellow Sea]|nr:COX15/CtaA family protein [Erythrobacteraceae bacterium E2-1 Yellow Sea]
MNTTNSIQTGLFKPIQAGPRPLALANWLLVVGALVVLIVMVGGITRLTESGLSITQWNPVTGVLPPVGEVEWQAEFTKYQATPEFIYEAGPAGMTLADFKFIFFWEWFHRLLGRVIGMVFALPLAWFWIKGAIPKGYKPRLLALLALGGLQGTFGWLMVRSGLQGTMTDVSHFWLSVHLLTAFFTLSGLVWTALDLRMLTRDASAQPARFTFFSFAVAFILTLQLLLGAWVAGLNAGHAAYDWPLMNGHLLPEFDLSLGWGRALTHDPFLLHFLHRWWAWMAVIALIMLARRIRQHERKASIVIHSTFGTQIILGIATVMTGVALWVAVAHQIVGALVVASTAWGLHIVGRLQRSST